jgi:hypothetical protein
VNSLITSIIDGIINFANDLLLPTMVLMFVGGVVLRLLIHYTIKREQWFAKAFEKRVYDYLHHHRDRKYTSFYVTTKMLLEKTYYELFIMRSVLKRRNPDVIMDKSDRIFLVQNGCARLVKDTLKHIQYFRYDMHRPNTKEITAQVFEKNPNFNNVLGYLPIGTFNEILNILPGIFIVGGIFGTFLGIMKALPELGAMDLADIEKTKQVMDHFLLKMSYSMITSILGIILNVAMTFLNALCNPGKVFVDIVERFNNALDTLWNACSDNLLPAEIPDFDEHKDPIEALAEDAVTKEVMKSKEYRQDNFEDDAQRLEAIVKSNSKANETEGQVAEQKDSKGNDEAA